MTQYYEVPAHVGFSGYRPVCPYCKEPVYQSVQWNTTSPVWACDLHGMLFNVLWLKDENDPGENLR